MARKVYETFTQINKTKESVIPAKAGIQYDQKLPGFRVKPGMTNSQVVQRFLYSICLMLFFVSPLWGQEAKKAIEVFPSTPYYQFIIFENLAIFWIAIIGLIVILRMKLREIEQRQKMGLDREETEAPRLD
jgi:hypothetical protein